MDLPVSDTSGYAHLFADDERGALDLEYRWLNAPLRDAPIAVFLHEGLGSIAMWKDWPQSVCDRLGFRGLVYSRPGYGKSTPRAYAEAWPVQFMQRQALDVLPALLETLGVARQERRRLWLIGHSDGGSIALLHAAAFPDGQAGVIAIAPHVMVEQLSVDSIAKARTAYLETNLREKLARYHDDVDSAFFGWNDIWLNPAFRQWDITDVLPAIRCPVLAVQGLDDEYGTMAQIDLIAAHAPQTRLVKLPRCGHSPHRDAADTLNSVIFEFVTETSPV